jgi:hypothetical protein
VWTVGSGSTENGLLVGTRLHKISQELTWQSDLADWRRPWLVSGGGLTARFTPQFNRHAETNLLAVASRTDQCFGVWDGSYQDWRFEALPGWAEAVHNRW